MQMEVFGTHFDKHRQTIKANQEFMIAAGGIEKAVDMQHLWNELDPKLRKRADKEVEFRAEATAKGYTGPQINLFLDLP